MRADAAQARQQHLAGLRDRAAGHHDRARRIGAGGIRRLAGVAMHDADARDRDAEYFVGDLGHRGFHALAMRVNAHPHFQPAVRRQPDRRLVVARHHGQPPGGEHRRAVRGLLGEGGKADADQPAVGLALLLPRAHCRTSIMSTARVRLAG